MNNIVELRVGELFAGAGGLSLGFILADHAKVRFRPVFAVDNNAASLESYGYNMNWLAQNAPDVLSKLPEIFERDVESLNGSDVLGSLKLKKGELDLLLGGPPCQGFSTSNRRGKEKSKEDRNRLINIFLDKLDDFRPKMFLIENVQGVQWTQPTEDMQLPSLQDSLFPDIAAKASSSSENVRNFLMQKAKALGYHVWCKVLNAVDFGVPQHRMRFFLFGVRADLVSDKDAVTLELFLEKLRISEKVSVRKAIGDLPALENGQRWDEGEYVPINDDFVRQMRRYIANGELYDHVATRHADYVIQRYKKIPEGGNWKNIREEMTNYKIVDNTHSNIYRRLIGSEPAITISHYRKSMIIHPSQDRGLSFREACRLQSFPDWCRFHGTTNDKQQQLANAVPPLMAAAVAKAIANFYLHNISLKSSIAASNPVSV
jgi:DNA-cytosine methyltransferase